jgi:hypothetical protein
MARRTAGTPAPDIHPDEEPVGLTIGADEIAAGIEEPPDEEPEQPIRHLVRMATADEQTPALPPELGELIAYPDGDYRVYRTERRDADLVRNTAPEIAIYARRERRR